MKLNREKVTIVFYQVYQPKTRGTRDHNRSPEYNNYFRFKLDFLANQIPWLLFGSARKTRTWQRTLRSCFLSSFVEFCSAVSKEKSKMSHPIRDQDDHLVFPIGLKHKLSRANVEDVAILLPVKFHWILFSGFREECQNGSANQRPRRPSYFSDRPENKLEDLVSCQVSFNSVQRFQRRCR